MAINSEVYDYIFYTDDLEAELAAILDQYESVDERLDYNASVDPDPKKKPEGDPNIQPENPGEGDDGDDDDEDYPNPFDEPGIGDDPGEERKKIPVF